MRYRNVCVEAFGHELPRKVVTSASLEERLATVYARVNRSFGRLELMTGVRERRVWEEGTPPSLPSTLAAEKAIARAGIEKKDIECLLHTSVSRDFLEPATATVVHNALGLPSTATIFDISNACLGFVNGMVTLANMIELGQIKAGIVVACESGGRMTEATIKELLEDTGITRGKLKTGLASLTMGSGSVSVVMTHSSISRSGHRLLGGVVRNASSEGILRNGLPLAAETWEAFKRELGWTEAQVDRVFTHQVSAVHHELLFDTLKLDKAKGFSTVEYLGNIGSVSLPISVAIGIEQGRLNPRDKVAMMAAGSGLNSIMLGLEW
jgi:3-oxoacyl-[acyl-carrier-protein] synthase III